MGVTSGATAESAIAEPPNTSGPSRYLAVPSGAQTTTGSSAGDSETCSCCARGSTQSTVISRFCTSGVIHCDDQAG